VAVFAQGAKAEEAKAAGADIVGMDDLAAMVKAGDMPFDVVIAAPDAMRVVGTLGQILGPRGLMPNPKVGTVTPDVATAVKNAKAGQVQFRVDKAGIVHGTIGRRSFDNDKLQGQPGCADRCADQSQAGNQQGCVPAQSGGLVDHGCGCSRGHPVHLGVIAGIRAALVRALPDVVGCNGQGRCRSSKTVGAWGTTLNRRAYGSPDGGPTQMAIPLQMD
jgi:hypothetical protein